MKKPKFRIISIALLSALIFTTGSNTMAKNVNYSTEDFPKMEESFKKMNDIATNAVEVNDIDRIANIKTIVSNSIYDGNVNLNHLDATLTFESSKVMDIKQSSEVYTSITIPVIGNDYSLLSNMTFILQDNKILEYTETLITKSEDAKFIIDTYIGGTLAESNHTNLSYIDNTEIQKSLDVLQGTSESQIQTYGFGETAGCIASIAGINIIVAYLIAGTCIAACPAVVPICVACITGVVAMGGSDIAGVIACFSL